MVNVFYLDQNPAEAARYNADQHVNKMLVEAGQILCTALRVNGFDDVPYDAFGQHHPVVEWVAASSQHWNWTYDLAQHLYNEHVRRGGNEDHTTWQKLQPLHCVGRISDNGWQQPAQAFGDYSHLENDDPVLGYRDYYAAAKHELRGKPASWPYDEPDWWSKHRQRVCQD